MHRIVVGRGFSATFTESTRGGSVALKLRPTRLSAVGSVANGYVAVATYVYDGLDRLAMKITHDYRQDGADLYDPVDTTKFYYYDTPGTGPSVADGREADGGRQILPQLIEVRDGDGEVTDQYVWGPSYVDELLIHDKFDGAGSLSARRIAVHDRQYSTLAAVDTDGGIVQRYTYSPYGADPTDPRRGLAMATDADGVVVANPADYATDALYTGRHYDAAIGQNHHRARWLEHALGRWTQRDPRGVASQVVHEQAFSVAMKPEPSIQYEDGYSVSFYARSNPLSGNDPSGLCAKGDKCYDYEVVGTPGYMDPRNAKIYIIVAAAATEIYCSYPIPTCPVTPLPGETSVALGGLYKKYWDSYQRSIWYRTRCGECKCGLICAVKNMFGYKGTPHWDIESWSSWNKCEASLHPGAPGETWKGHGEADYQKLVSKCKKEAELTASSCGGSRCP